MQSLGTLWVNLEFAKKTKKKSELFLSPRFGSRLREYNLIDLRFVCFFANVNCKMNSQFNCNEVEKLTLAVIHRLCTTRSYY